MHWVACLCRLVEKHREQGSLPDLGKITWQDLNGVVIINLHLFQPTSILESSPHRTGRKYWRLLSFALLPAQLKRRIQSRRRNFHREKSIVFCEWCSPPQVNRVSARKSQANSKRPVLRSYPGVWSYLLCSLPSTILFIHSRYSIILRCNNMAENLLCISAPQSQILRYRHLHSKWGCNRGAEVQVTDVVPCMYHRCKSLFIAFSRFQGFSRSLPYAAEESLLQTALQNWRRISNTSPQPAFCGPNPAICMPCWHRWPCAGHPLSPEDCCISSCRWLASLSRGWTSIAGVEKRPAGYHVIILNLLNTRCLRANISLGVGALLLHVGEISWGWEHLQQEPLFLFLSRLHLTSAEFLPKYGRRDRITIRRGKNKSDNAFRGPSRAQESQVDLWDHSTCGSLYDKNWSGRSSSWVSQEWHEKPCSRSSAFRLMPRNRAEITTTSGYWNRPGNVLSHVSWDHESSSSRDTTDVHRYDMLVTVLVLRTYAQEDNSLTSKLEVDRAPSRTSAKPTKKIKGEHTRFARCLAPLVFENSSEDIFRSWR